MFPILFSRMPIIDSKTTEVFGYEVLLRRAGELTLSAFNKQPALFINHHKQLIAALQSLDEENKIREKGQQLFINLLPDQLISQQGISTVEALQLKPDYPLIIEITETSLTHSHSELNDRLQQLIENGCQLAIDDFGCANSNFLRVLALSPHYIKLDQSFIQSNNGEYTERNKLKQLVTFFHNLGTKVIVEGVETEQQYKLVQGINADYVQGFYFGYPEPI
ncbi:EAL domain-containing protein [Colwellia psychrerythraea]|uniref:Diguanylate phosphodiesterase n=1 Tax=Colwellia psychrerythraea TaxID=28229 RepID=A0A099KB45_COLPS|nr:EAL domain-containing protein [Colwellia psychrerythraea]KGJ87959.1 diguanylate phosphodiesterase [Colwellia psychrerythraea]